jgi:N-ethylmaleimide reductase
MAGPSRIAPDSCFIANPDLPCRFALGAQLNLPDPKTFYAALRDVGYTDYPTLRTIGG